MDVVHLKEAGPALALAEPQLRASGAEGELVYGILRRLVDEPNAWGETTILIGSGDDGPQAITQMTGSHPVLIVGFTDPRTLDHGALVAAMKDAGRLPPGVNGAERWAEPYAEAWRATGATTEVGRRSRAFELRTVRPPRMPAGRMRTATDHDHPLMVEWVMAFGDDIGETIERSAAEHWVTTMTAAHDLAVWERGGEPVSIAAVNRRTPASSCIAYVYTPPALRGNGYASAVVAELSQRELDAGREWCSLFTDLANPTTNHIYAEIGYEPKTDFVHYLLTHPGT